MGVGSGHRQGIRDPFHWKSSTSDKGSRKMSFFAANANGFLENFNLQRFVAENTFQLKDSLFQGLCVGNTDDLGIGFNGCFTDFAHLFFSTVKQIRNNAICSCHHGN